MAIYRAVIVTATSELLRTGYTDFENDGSFDAATETVIITDPTSIPEPAPGDVVTFDGVNFVVVPRNLIEVKTEKVFTLNKQITEYLEERYSPAVQRSLTLFLGEANSKAYTVRAQHIQAGIDWVNESLGEYYTKRDAVNAAVDAAAVNAIELDLDTLDLSDPQLTLEGARAILE